MQSNQLASGIRWSYFHTVLWNYLLAKLKKYALLVKQWQQNRRTRYYLAEMSEHMLKDIGITEAERQDEITKKFWQ